MTDRQKPYRLHWGSCCELHDPAAKTEARAEKAEAEYHEALEREGRVREKLEKAEAERDELKAELRRAEAERGATSKALADVLEENAGIAELNAKVERLRVQLAGCGAVALANTPQTHADAGMDRDAYGWSASYQAVWNAVGREIELRAEVERLRGANETLMRMAKRATENPPVVDGTTSGDSPGTATESVDPGASAGGETEATHIPGETTWDRDVRAFYAARTIGNATGDDKRGSRLMRAIKDADAIEAERKKRRSK